MASGTLAQGVVRKVRRITTLDLSSDHLRESLMALSNVEVQPGNGRTALKSSMESALLNCSRTFSSDWEHFVQVGLHNTLDLMARLHASDLFISNTPLL